MGYSLETLSENNVSEWEKFNRESREGSPFHGMSWKNILEDEFHAKTRYYLIRDQQKVLGICPFIERSAAYFHGLTCIPNSETNNILLDDSFDIERINEVLSSLAKKYSFLQLNTSNPDLLERITYDTFQQAETGNMIVDLKKNPPDAIWEKLFVKDDRYRIRLFEKEGFRMQEMKERRDLEEYYRYYVKNLTYINGEILPFSFFQRCCTVFPPGDVRIAVLKKGDQFASGTLSIPCSDNRTFYCRYLALNRDLPNRFTPSLKQYWEEINWAWENGFDKFSFGRQKWDPRNPRFKIKIKFGAQHVPIHSRIVSFSKAASLLYGVYQRIIGE
jgi:hypothetical protein